MVADLLELDRCFGFSLQYATQIVLPFSCVKHRSEINLICRWSVNDLLLPQNPLTVKLELQQSSLEKVDERLPATDSDSEKVCHFHLFCIYSTIALYTNRRIIT